MKTRLPMYETPLDPLALTSAGTRVSDFTPNTPEQAKHFKKLMDEYNKKLWTIYNA